MEKRLLSMILVVLLGITLLAGCKKNVGTPEDNAVSEAETENDSTEEAGYTFGYCCIDMSNPYYDSLQLSIKTTLEDSGNHLITKNPQGDIDTQLEQINELIEAGVDSVFLCPVDWEAIAPGLQALKDAGIPIINIDTQVKDSDMIDAYVGSDNKNAGFVCGEDLIKKMPEGGKIVVLECQTMNSINDRITGFEEAIVDNGFEVIERANAQGEEKQAKIEIERMLAKYDQIDVIMCGNDQMALGALEAVKAAGRQNIKIYGVDGSPEIKTELAKGNSQIEGTGAQSPINIGKKVVDTALAIMNHEQYEPEVYEPTFFIDKDNVELYGTDGWQ